MINFLTRWALVSEHDIGVKIPIHNQVENHKHC